MSSTVTPTGPPNSAPTGTGSDATCPPTFERHLDAGWSATALVDDVRLGLGATPWQLPPTWLYDDRGSELFDAITRLPEYYPTEAERSILHRHAGRIAEVAAADTIVELGSGTSDKTRTLLDACWTAGTLRRFVPFDVSEQTLRAAAGELAARYPGLAVHGIVGDFTRHLHHVPSDGRTMIAFLGSTIGNFYPHQRAAFLAAVADALAPGGTLLLGVDLVKPVERLLAAYDDDQGITAEFTRNVLRVLNRELDADFVPEAFEHVALWDRRHERMDLRLRAHGDHHVEVPGAGLALDVHDGDEIRIEVCTKFRLPVITKELADAGLQVRLELTDDAGDVAVLLAERS